MTKEVLNQMCEEYQRVLSMNEEEVFTMYEESKSECIASFEAEIDYWENHFGYRY
ncbi:1-aminocyclopropane-1-carboxylate synthase [Bacteroides sp. 51]|uniref:1-aminocyclopropane-1-carboxylate synthase n=1 Tax=Bacteroides sp. 51 TaxID=2302938 RepID=UPI0013D0D647|nr:1-aminocyclopropane-1-carboxylate synthase [Bacteroides sp. 51]NDV82224.1 1-aminocyclopropane-1-carboxylate synthase [Bacteroides sp. 51]